MSTLDIKGITISVARRLLDEKEVSSEELTQAYLDRIANIEGNIHSFVRVTADTAIEPVSYTHLTLPTTHYV